MVNGREERESVGPIEQLAPVVSSHARPFWLIPLRVPLGMNAVKTLANPANPDLVMGAEPFDDLFGSRKLHFFSAVVVSGRLTP